MATFAGTTLNDTLSSSNLSDLIYGLAGNDSLSANDGADTLDGGAGADTLTGHNGDDTYIIDNAKDTVIDITTDANDRVQASITIDLQTALYDGVEHVTLTGTAALNATGDDGNNMLIGNGGANKLDGKGADDTMAGGGGNDTYTVDALDEQVIEYAAGGTDQVNSTASYILRAYLENLTLTGSASVNGDGNALANKVTGNAGNNGLFGDAGNDTLTGNDGADTVDGGAGADSLAGGKGADVYLVDDIGDKVTDSGAAGEIDRVESAITYLLGSNLEDLTLQGSAAIDGTGNTLNNALTGNSGNNLLSGLAGNDSLLGAAGDDLMIGGDGADTLGAADGSDTLVGGGGNDVFAFSKAFAIDRDLILDLNALPSSDKLDVSQLLTGVTTANVDQFLQTVVAGGVTTLRVDLNGGANSFINLATLAGVGTDLNGLIANAVIDGIGIVAPVSTTGLSGNDTLASGSTSALLQGLAGNDSLTGGAGFDTLDGGPGTDTLAGGLASDTYIIDSAKDAIIESGGTDDRIQAALAIDLQSAVYDGIEHVTLTGTAALNATGDEFANMLIGNSGANKLDGKGEADTLIGGAGSDTYQVDDELDFIVELAGEGTDQANASLSYFLDDFVENLTLTGAGDIFGVGNAIANKVTGNAGANKLEGEEGNDTLTGNDGNDTLDGGAGADSLTGGKGNDVYVVDDIGDKVAEAGLTTDVDRVDSFITHILGNNLEDLTLLEFAAIDGTGNSLANAITGNGGTNVLSGLAGNDTLSGSFGEDTLIGGTGSDVFTFDFASANDGDFDLIVDFSGLPGGDILDLAQLLTGATKANAAGFLNVEAADGNTTIQVDFDGGADNFFDLAVLQGVCTDLNGLIANATVAGLGALVATPITGLAGADTLAGAATSSLVQGLGGNDSLTGGAGLDTLDGGTGSDTLAGGGGSDTYIVDAAADKIADSGGADDRLQASITVDLRNAAYDGVEHATLTGTAALNATGDEFHNMLIGNSGANKLDGQGDNDTMIGGAGSDTYEVDHFEDVIVEYSGEGTDQVNSTASYTLAGFVENLTLLGTAGFGEGNALANKVTGNASNNDLRGFDGNDTLTGNDGDDNLTGGAGADSLVGGKGNDTYQVDNVGDKISETGPSTDVEQVFSTVSYTLGTNLEHLSLVEAGAIDATGNALANLITGGAGNNVISGLAGNDVLDGRGGDDLLLGGDGVDQLVAGAGSDTLIGGAGNDEFLFLAGSLDGREMIADFNAAPGGDILNLEDLLTGFDADTSNINDFLQTELTATGTIVRVDGNGGGDSFVDAVLLEGVNTDLAGLLNSGLVIA